MEVATRFPGGAVHRLLAIPELVRHITDQLNDVFDGIDEPTCASLARTCRAFCSPALDVLWSYQGNLMNLIKCMPEDLLDIAPYGHGFRILVRPLATM